jgi:hypothetical protein
LPGSPAELLANWHDFYSLVGTASATLVGLMFVAASIGSNVFNEEHRAPMKAFITPTVVHFSAVLFVCLLVIIPNHGWRTLGGLLGAGGLAGVIYAGKIWFDVGFRRLFKVDFSDRLFYALIPVVGYLAVLAAAVLLVMRSAASADLIAAGLLILLLAGIRNAWDMTIWIAIRVPSGSAPPPAAPENAPPDVRG